MIKKYVVIALCLCAFDAFAIEIKVDSVSKEVASATVEEAKKLSNGDDPVAALSKLVSAAMVELKSNVSSSSDEEIQKVEAEIQSTLESLLKHYKADVGNFDSTAASKAYNTMFFRNIDESVAGVVKSSLEKTEGEKINLKLAEISERVNSLDSDKPKKMLRLGADVDFLYAATFGSGDIFFGNPSNNVSDKDIDVNGKKVKSIEFNSYLNDTVTLADGTEVNDESFILESKLRTVEVTLNINQKYETMRLKERVEAAYNEINNEEWETDNIRFGVNIAHLGDVSTISASAAMHAYFGYRRFLPGDIRDIARRLSFMFALGTSLQTSGSGGIEGPIYTVGLGFDIEKGMALTAGYSVYSYRVNTMSDFKDDNSVSIGMSLNADFWDGLRGK